MCVCVTADNVSLVVPCPDTIKNTSADVRSVSLIHICSTVYSIHLAITALRSFGPAGSQREPFIKRDYFDNLLRSKFVW